MPRSWNYKLWDPDQHAVVISPNVIFNGSSTADSSILPSPDCHLMDLREAFDVCDPPYLGTMSRERPPGELKDAERGEVADESEWESDAKILWPKVTEDKAVPNGTIPVVLLIPREPELCVCRHHRSEVKCLPNTAGPPPTWEKRRAHATMSNNHTSVGVVEIEEKDKIKARRSAYCEALLAAENMQLHNKPVDVKDAKQRPDWEKWKTAMQEELNSLK